jgi:hypothetical protein
MATKSRLIQVGLVCESPKAQQINQRFTVDRRIHSGGFLLLLLVTL